MKAIDIINSIDNIEYFINSSPIEGSFIKYRDEYYKNRIIPNLRYVEIRKFYHQIALLIHKSGILPERFKSSDIDSKFQLLEKTLMSTQGNYKKESWDSYYDLIRIVNINSLIIHIGAKIMEEVFHKNPMVVYIDTDFIVYNAEYIDFPNDLIYDSGEIYYFYLYSIKRMIYLEKPPYPKHKLDKINFDGFVYQSPKNIPGFESIKSQMIQMLREEKIKSIVDKIPF